MSSSRAGARIQTSHTKWVQTTEPSLRLPPILRFFRLEDLPLELFYNILYRLPAASILALKLASRTLYLMTKTSDGSEVINIAQRYKGLLWDEQWPERREFGKLKARLEATTSSHLLDERLTCAECAKTKDHSSTGFPDNHFRRRRAKRYCIDCTNCWGKRGISVFRVHGFRMSHCNRCWVVTKHEEKHGEGEFSICHKCCEHEFEHNPHGMFARQVRLSRAKTSMKPETRAVRKRWRNTPRRYRLP